MVGGRSGSNWPKGSTRAKRSLFHKRNGQGLLLVDGRSKYWDLAEEPFTQSPPNASQPNASGLSRGPDAQSQSNVSSGNSRLVIYCSRKSLQPYSSPVLTNTCHVESYSLTSATNFGSLFFFVNFFFAFFCIRPGIAL